jgi:hypothetical protein
MYPQPEDPDVVDRMRAAHRRARAALAVRHAPDKREAWGWHGRTLSRTVTCADGPAWLRLACAPSGQSDHIFWRGSLEARDAIPAAVPRPRLRTFYDFHDQAWEYRAELYDYVTTHPIAPSPVLTAQHDLPPAWWAALRAALDTISTVPTSRCTTTQRYLDWAMPKFLGTRIDARTPAWATAHGDLHWANLCGPQLQIFDWEGWGLAPAGYDAAMLHSCTLLVPGVAERVRSELADMLDTPTGRFAELVAITELLHGTTRGANLPLAEPLRHRAAGLLRDTPR